MEGAKIHAENSIRQKNQALNYRRMSARIDAVAARVQTAVTTKQVSATVDIYLLLSQFEVCPVEQLHQQQNSFSCRTKCLN